MQTLDFKHHFHFHSLINSLNAKKIFIRLFKYLIIYLLYIEMLGERTENLEEYGRFEIAQLVTLPGDECVCILKTVWIRIFQRHIKKWIQNKQYISKLVKTPRFFILRECGKYVQDTY